MTPGGHRIGTLCVLDTEPHAGAQAPTDAQVEQLESLASMVVDELELRQRVRAERRGSQKRLRLLSKALDQAHEAILITEAAPIEAPGPRIAYVNPAFETMTGYAEDELLGQTPRLLQGPETERDVLGSLRAALEAGEPWSGETTNHRKDGTPYVVQWNIAPVRAEDGTIEHWVSVQHDVTEARRRKAALRRSQERYRSLFNDSSHAILVHDIGGRISEANPMAERLFGVDDGALEGRSVLDLYPPEARVAFQASQRSLEAGLSFQVETPCMRADGSTFWGAVSSRVVDLGERSVVRTLVRNVSNRRTAEQELAAARREPAGRDLHRRWRRPPLRQPGRRRDLWRRLGRGAAGDAAPRVRGVPRRGGGGPRAHPARAGGGHAGAARLRDGAPRRRAPHRRVVRRAHRV